MKVFFIIVLICFFTDSDLVHKEAPLQVDNKGNITGLPEEYSPALFDRSKNILRIRNRIIEFPECIGNYFEIYHEPTLRLSASWYHSKEVMPYYVNFEISDKNQMNSYDILVDLETLELISIWKERKDGDAIFEEPITLSDTCLSDYQKGLRILY